MQPRHLFTPLVFCFLIVNICGCTSNEIGESKDVAQETIYQQYSISYNEGDENAAVYAQFRFAGDNGTTLVLTKPSSLQFDGVTLVVDSSDFEGAFYKKYIPVNGFYHDHHIRFTDINQRVYDNQFSFDVFKLVNTRETVARDQPLQFQFSSLHLGPEDYIEIFSVDADSSFSVTYSGKDTSQCISIPAEELKRQKGPQLKLAATLHKKYRLQQNTKEGGILEIVYTLKPFMINLLIEKMLYTSN